MQCGPMIDCIGPPREVLQLTTMREGRSARDHTIADPGTTSPAMIAVGSGRSLRTNAGACPNASVAAQFPSQERRVIREVMQSQANSPCGAVEGRQARSLPVHLPRATMEVMRVLLVEDESRMAGSLARGFREQ